MKGLNFYISVDRLYLCMHHRPAGEFTSVTFCSRWSRWWREPGTTTCWRFCPIQRRVTWSSRRTPRTPRPACTEEPGWTRRVSPHSQRVVLFSSAVLMGLGGFCCCFLLTWPACVVHSDGFVGGEDARTFRRSGGLLEEDPDVPEEKSLRRLRPSSNPPVPPVGGAWGAVELRPLADWEDEGGSAAVGSVVFRWNGTGRLKLLCFFCISSFVFYVWKKHKL